MKQRYPMIGPPMTAAQARARPEFLTLNYVGDINAALAMVGTMGGDQFAFLAALTHSHTVDSAVLVGLEAAGVV